MELPFHLQSCITTRYLVHTSSERERWIERGTITNEVEEYEKLVVD